MGNEVNGYYGNQKKTLLEDFHQTIKLMKNQQNFANQITDSLENELILEYEIIIPEIPYLKGYR